MVFSHVVLVSYNLNGISHYLGLTALSHVSVPYHIETLLSQVPDDAEDVSISVRLNTESDD